MKLVTTFSTLVSNLDSVTSVVEDKLIDESARNIIFKITETGVSLMGYSLLAICKTPLEEGSFSVSFEDGELVDGVMYMQIKSKELNNFLGTFKSLKKTKPSEVEFQTINGKVRLIVTEDFMPTDEDEEIKSQKSVWVFDNIPVKSSVIKAIEIEANKEDEERIDSVSLLMYINSMLPLLSDEGNSLPSKLNFCEDYVCAVPNKFATLFSNTLPKAFKGVSLNYSAISFLKKVLATSEVVFISRTETHISVITERSEAFLNYLTKLPNTQLYLEYYKKDHAIVVDRLYLKDVLKRLSVINENATITIDSEEGVLKVKNSKFSQEVPILSQKGMDELGSVTFKLATDVISKAIIGDDAVFTAESTDLRIYVVKTQTSGYMLYITDAYDMWFSVIQVR